MTREEFMSLPDKVTFYSDWFGSGCLKKDLIEEEESAGKQAEWVKLDDSMALAKIGENYVCFGYDSNEYCHSFTF